MIADVFAGREISKFMVKELADRVGILEEDVQQLGHLDVDINRFHADKLARLLNFPSIHSLTVSMVSLYPDRREPWSPPAFVSQDMKDDSNILQAIASLKTISCLFLTEGCGDSLNQLPWEQMRGLQELHTMFADDITQGTYYFLPRIPWLEHLRADIDLFSLQCMSLMTGLTSLDLRIAFTRGDRRYYSNQTRDDQAMTYIATLPRLQKLQFVQEASLTGLQMLTRLAQLTDFCLWLPKASCSGHNLWEVTKFLQSNTFRLDHLCFEFMMSGKYVVASLKEHDAASSMSDPHISVPWCDTPIVIRVNDRGSGAFSPRRYGRSRRSPSRSPISFDRYDRYDALYSPKRSPSRSLSRSPSPARSLSQSRSPSTAPSRSLDGVSSKYSSSSYSRSPSQSPVRSPSPNVDNA